MSKVTCGVSMSIDGFIAGNNMTLEHPFGDISPMLLNGWQFHEAEDNQLERESLVSAGAYIMGRNMFGPKDLQADPSWIGWWEENPPYHAPVYVLSRTEHEPIALEGGTTFYFVTDGIQTAMKQAQAAAGTRDVAIAGGANTINQYLAAGLIDELWLHIGPVTVGSGQRLFEGVPNLKMKPLSVRTTDTVTHIKYEILRG